MSPKQSRALGTNNLDDLPDLPELKTLSSQDRAALTEWWRLVREVLKRSREEIKTP